MKRLETYCAEHIPPHVRDQIRIEMTTRGNSVTIWECRPPWRPDFGPEWTRTKVAQLRYDPDHFTWTMFWADRNGKWLAYPRLPSTANFDKVLDELDLDPLACFWG
jgi:hypothetical protein